MQYDQLLRFGVAVLALAAGGVRAQTERVVYRFPPSAFVPESVTPFLGSLYGITYSGGDSKNCPFTGGGCGSVFRVSPNGHYQQLYAFQNGADGAIPVGPLVRIGGTFYGVTFFGGSSADTGTLFSITPAGKLTVLHTFGAAGDGRDPEGITVYRGKIEGTTQGGGDPTCNCGLVFEYAPGAGYRPRYVFKGGPDGGAPLAPPVVMGPDLYGTTADGGDLHLPCVRPRYGNGCGVIWQLKPDDSEIAYFTFHGKADGDEPVAITAIGGTIYGQTFDSELSYHHAGPGLLFAIPRRGSEQILHSFTGGADGFAASSFVQLNGIIYGVTVTGGSNPCECGQIVSLGAGNTYAPIFSFNVSGGAYPESIVPLGGALFGVSEGQGTKAACSRK